MPTPIKLVSTDFDGTLHADFEMPPVPEDLQDILEELQAQGTRWVINTGRDLSSIMEGMARARLRVKPDYLVVVERHIYRLDGAHYHPLESWNKNCQQAHHQLFEKIRPDIRRLESWIRQRFQATLYEDDFSPLCLIADNHDNAGAIHSFLETYCREIEDLCVVRNDIYARFSHVAYSKGTALQEIARALDIPPESTLAAGDHFNDLPMLMSSVARHLVAPDNAIDEVKQAVLRQNGYVSRQPWGHGVARGLEHYLKSASA